MFARGLLLAVCNWVGRRLYVHDCVQREEEMPVALCVSMCGYARTVGCRW